MSRRPALVTQEDMERAIRAAKKIGGFEIEIRGASILLRPTVPRTIANDPVAEPKEIVL